MRSSIRNGPSFFARKVREDCNLGSRVFFAMAPTEIALRTDVTHMQNVNGITPPVIVNVEYMAKMFIHQTLPGPNSREGVPWGLETWIANCHKLYNDACSQYPSLAHTPLEQIRKSKRYHDLIDSHIKAVPCKGRRGHSILKTPCV